MIKLYSSPKWLQPGVHGGRLGCLFSLDLEPRGRDDVDASRFEGLVEVIFKHFQRVDSIDNADYLYIPHDYRTELKPLFDLAYRNSIAYRKPLLIFYNNDCTKPLDYPAALVCRTSMRGSKASPNEFVMPAWSAPPDWTYAQFQENIKSLVTQQRRSFSYCGYSSNSTSFGMYLMMIMLRNTSLGWGFLEPFVGPSLLRHIVLSQLKRVPQLEASVIIREGFWANLVQDRRESREQYVDNMKGSIYALAVRGGGNFSYRLYEALALGRIPIMLNTDMRMPFDWMIDYDRHMLTIPSSRLHQMPEMVRKFNNTYESYALLEMAASNKALYDSWLSPRGFFSRFNRVSEKFMSTNKLS